MESYYKEHPVGDGFVAIKQMEENLVFGYKLKRLSSGLEIDYVRRNTFDNLEKEVIYQMGPYNFYKEAFDYVNKTVDDFIKNKVSPIYLDEISLLELKNLGFHSVLKRILESDIDLILVIREDLLAQILKKYNITDYEFL
jgi:nucleoside-triphosphatase THEP1